MVGNQNGIAVESLSSAVLAHWEMVGNQNGPYTCIPPTAVLAHWEMVGNQNSDDARKLAEAF